MLLASINPPDYIRIDSVTLQGVKKTSKRQVIDARYLKEVRVGNF
jgi:hypothetical protein